MLTNTCMIYPSPVISLMLSTFTSMLMITTFSIRRKKLMQTEWHWPIGLLYFLLMNEVWLPRILYEYNIWNDQTTLLHLYKMIMINYQWYKLYNKTSFRVKHQGWFSFLIRNLVGVNQGGVASGFLFRRYLSDLDRYLNTHFGICAGDMIVAHILWAVDLVLMAHSTDGMQVQLNNLSKYCSKNLQSVNEIKTKCMVIGHHEKLNLKFNGKGIEEVENYKYLGNIFRSLGRVTEDVFRDTYPYLCGQGRRAIFSIRQRLRNIHPVPPTVMFKLYDMLVKPILIYGSDVWGYSKQGQAQVDKIMLHYCRCVLNVKASTSNIITFGECGILPPSVYTQISVLCFMNRLHHMSESTIVKQVYNELCKLHSLGYDTWVSKVSELTQHFCLNNDMTTSEFKRVCKQTLVNSFITTWDAERQNLEENPILRFYNKIKHTFGTENYLIGVKDDKFRTALAKLRSSSHTPAIESGRHSRPKVNVHERLCHVCQCVEDEIHFMLDCQINNDERAHFFTKVTRAYPEFESLSNIEKCDFVLSNQDNQLMTWAGKFIYKSFARRSEILNGPK